MEQQNIDLDIIKIEEEALKRLIEEEGIPVVRKKEDVTLTLFDGKSKVVVKVPKATTISEYYDRTYQGISRGSGTTEAEIFLLSQCLVSYTLYDPDTGEILIEGHKDKDKKNFIPNFLDHIHPLVFRWLIRKLVLLSGMDYTKVLQKMDEVRREISGVPVGGAGEGTGE